MTYQLAKQLKDAGFPQSRILSYQGKHKEKVYIPRLSELISECKKDLESIMTIVHYRHYSDDKIVRFEAIGIKRGEKKAGVNAIINEREGGMKEAIALLYLKLNKKQ